MADQVRPRLFIASATGSLTVARAFHAALESEAEVTIWDQSVFPPSSYILPTLVERTSASDFAIMVVGADGVRIRPDDTHALAANENVLVELGLFVGTLGIERVYLAVPRQNPPVELPSDLQGLIVTYYDGQRIDGNVQAAVATAADKIARRIKDLLPEIRTRRRRRIDVRYFEEFSSDMASLCASSARLDTCFIHSRRWREQYGAILKQRIADGSLTEFNLFLPDVRRPAILTDVLETFDDGPAIPAMIYDSFRWSTAMAKLKPGVIRVHLYPNVPGHTFYRFDDAALIALYPAAVEKKSVPTLLCFEGTQVWDFLDSDIKDLKTHCAAVSYRTLESLCRRFEATQRF